MAGIATCQAELSWSTLEWLPPRGAPARPAPRVLLASPRGFCGGVIRAVSAVEAALARRGAPVYVRPAIVHNAKVVARLEALGAVVVQEVEMAPERATVVFSAHGVSPAVRNSALARQQTIVDATCPFVAKLHRAAASFAAAGFDVALVGKRGHDEVVGTLGQAPGFVHLVESAAQVARLVVRDPARVACLSQTTLAPADIGPVVAALRARFPALVQPPGGDVCRATYLRQAATRALARAVDAVLVFGDQTSSNAQRLREVAAAEGRPAYLLGGIEDLRQEWLAGATSVGLSAGASTPEDVITGAVAYFTARGAVVSEYSATSGRPAAARRAWEAVA